MGTNLATYEFDQTLKAAREAEVPLADFDGGMNKGGSNAPGIGVNTGNYDPKAQDWPRIEDTEPHNSQHIGQDPDSLYVDTGPLDQVAFVQAEGDTDPDDPLDTTTGALNKTGAVVPEDAWCWGVIEA